MSVSDAVEADIDRLASIWHEGWHDAHSRGSGAATVLIDDAEAQLATSGVETAWLACAIGNERAARFYEKRGWRRARVEAYHAETSSGAFPLEIWRYEKLLR